MPVVQKITDINAIRLHLFDVSVLRIPVSGTIQGGDRLFNCRLIYAPDTPDIFHLSASRADISQHGRIMLSYTTIHSPFTFSSTIDSVQQLAPQQTLLTIQVPRSVSRFNRRKHIRVQPPQASPVLLNLDLPASEALYPDVADISSGGVAFNVPHDQAYFDIGKQYPARLHIPGMGEISSHIASRNLKKIFNMFRVGAEFIDISEEDREKIERYTIKYESHASENSLEMGFDKKPSVLVIDMPEHARYYQCLEATCDMKQAPPASAPDAAIAHAPELIILNLDFSESAAAFKAAREHMALRGRPMILVSAKEREIFFQVPEWQFMSIPFRESLFFQKAKQLISDYRCSRKLEAIQAGCLTGKKILVLDLPRTFGFKTIDYLKGYNYQVSVFYHAKNILGQMVREKPAFIIINAMDTPVLKDICQLMRLNRAVKDIPKILIHDKNDLAHDLMSNGLISETMPAPADPWKLLARLQSYE